MIFISCQNYWGGGQNDMFAPNIFTGGNSPPPPPPPPGSTPLVKMIIPCRSVWIGNIIFTDRVTVCPHSTLCDILIKKKKIMRTFMRGAAGAGGQLPPLLFFDYYYFFFYLLLFCCCCLSLSAQRSVMSMMIIPLPHYESKKKKN